MTTATLPVLWLACGAIWKLSYVCLKWLAHASIAVPAVAGIFPPSPPDPPKLTISPPASNADDLPAACPAALLRLCDFMADRGAYFARAGRKFDAYALVAIPDGAQIQGARDVLLLAWAARLGYREGLEVAR